MSTKASESIGLAERVRLLLRRFVRLLGHPLLWFGIAVAIVIAASLLRASAAGKDVVEVPLAIIGGGLLSTWVILFVEDRRRAGQTRDLQYALATELNLNIVWAKYNTVAITGAGGKVAWVPFRFDAFLEVLKNRTAISLSDEVWDTIEQAVDRMHAFNADRETLYSLSGSNSDPLPDLRRAMSGLAGQLCYYFFPLLVGDLPYTEVARRHYGTKLDDKSLARLQHQRKIQPRPESTDVLKALIKEVWGVSIG